MKLTTKITTLLSAGALVILAVSVQAQWAAPDVQEESDPEVIQKALTGGVPMGRWKEGLLFEGISPHPWLKSAANWFPNTEEVQPNEMRIHFMGTAPMIRPGPDEHIHLGNVGQR